jgi:hypothetical protein
MKRMAPPWVTYARRVPVLRSIPWLLTIAAVACALPTAPTLPPTPLTLPLAGETWTTISTPEPLTLANEGRDLTFEFPGTGSIHYLYAPSTLALLRGTLVVSTRVTMTGAASFSSLDPITVSCSIPVTVRPFIWSNGNGEGPYDRWWSNPRAIALVAGSATIEVPLLPEFWSSVNGVFGNGNSAARAGFTNAITNVSRLGVTFGGGCSFGHGVRVQGGTASFALTEYAIR